MNFQQITKENLTNESYHNRPNSLSSSDLKTLEKSVDKWKFEKANRKESKAMDTGTYFHKLVLEPESYKPMVLPKVNMAAKGGEKEKSKGAIDLNLFLDMKQTFKQSYSLDEYKKMKLQDLKDLAEFKIETFKDEDFDIIDQEAFDKVESMKEGLAQHDQLGLEGGGLLNLSNEGAEIESSFIIPLQALSGFENEEIELELRIRPDYFIAGKYIADLKSTLTADPKRFKYEVFKWGYHVSAAFYLDCYNAYIKYLEKKSEIVAGFENTDSRYIGDFFLIACENTGSGICTVFKLDQDLIELGRQEYQKGLKNYIRSQMPFVYGGYSEEIVHLGL